MAGTCHHRSLTDDTKHQVALNTYELDVFSIAVWGGLRPPVQVDGKMHVDCWIQQVTTRVGAVTCLIQQSVSPKQVVGFSCLFNAELTN